MAEAKQNVNEKKIFRKSNIKLLRERVELTSV